MIASLPASEHAPSPPTTGIFDHGDGIWLPEEAHVLRAVGFAGGLWVPKRVRHLRQRGER